MQSTIYYRENVTPLLAALFASIEGNSDYDQGRRQGILLVMAALDISPAHVSAAIDRAALAEQRQPQLRIIDQPQSARRLTSGR